MKEGYNRIVLAGSLGQDPEQRSFASGGFKIEFRMATTQNWKDRDGKPQEDTQWHTVEVWGGHAQALSKFLVKGMDVLVEGMMKYDQYTNRDGNKATKAFVKADNVFVLSRRGDSVRAPAPTREKEDHGDIPF